VVDIVTRLWAGWSEVLTPAGSKTSRLAPGTIKPAIKWAPALFPWG